MSRATGDAIRHVLTIALGIFCAEALVMLILAGLPPLGTVSVALIDSTLLTVLLTPLFFWSMYRPFRHELSERMEAEQRLSSLLIEAKQVNKTLSEAQEQLLSSERMVAMGHLAAGVAHEINNPIGFVGSNLTSMQKYQLGLFELLQAYEATHDLIERDNVRFTALRALREKIDIDYVKGDVQDLLRESLDGIERVRQIVRDLKDFSRADNGVWEMADINAELERTLNVARNELKYHVTIVKELGEIAPVECISARVNQVFLNLLVNAAQAIKDKGTITIATAQDGDEVRITIVDTGSGMSQEQLKRAFEPFYTTKPRGLGTGLGLSVSLGIVEKHHGRIAVRSTLGVGTTFDVFLPVRQPECEAASKDEIQG